MNIFQHYVLNSIMLLLGIISGLIITGQITKFKNEASKLPNQLFNAAYFFVFLVILIAVPTLLFYPFTN